MNRPELYRFAPLGQLRYERRLPPGARLEVERDPLLVRLVRWIFAL